MSSNVPGMERHAKTLRAWQLAILRFAVTLDNADRLAVLIERHRVARSSGGTASKPSRATANKEEALQVELESSRRSS